MKAPGAPQRRRIASSLRWAAALTLAIALHGAATGLLIRQAHRDSLATAGDAPITVELEPVEGEDAKPDVEPLVPAEATTASAAVVSAEAERAVTKPALELEVGRPPVVPAMTPPPLDTPPSANQPASTISEPPSADRLPVPEVLSSGQLPPPEPPTPPTSSPVPPSDSTPAKLESSPPDAVEPPPPAPQATPAKTPPTDTSQASAPAAEDAAPVAQRPSAAREAAWRGALVAHLNHFRRFPPGLGGGTARVAFTIDAQGRVQSIAVVAGSGSALLDIAARELIERASPFPAPPAGLSDRALSFVVPVHFDAHRR